MTQGMIGKLRNGNLTRWTGGSLLLSQVSLTDADALRDGTRLMYFVAVLHLHLTNLEGEIPGKNPPPALSSGEYFQNAVILWLIHSCVDVTCHIAVLSVSFVFLQSSLDCTQYTKRRSTKSWDRMY